MQNNHKQTKPMYKEKHIDHKMIQTATERQNNCSEAQNSNKFQEALWQHS